MKQRWGLFALLITLLVIDIGPARASHSNVLGHWYHGFGQAAGAPIEDRTGRPDLAQLGAETWYNASNGRYVTWVAEQNGNWSNCSVRSGWIVACLDWNVNWNGGDAAYAEVFLSGGHITACVIHIYPHAYFKDLTPHGFENLVWKHETGHCAGLGHASSTSSIMYPTIDFSRPNPTQHDIDAMSSMYTSHWD